jgi:hypothetical protein
MTEGSNGFAALALAIGIASEVHRRNSEQTNLTHVQIARNSEPRAARGRGPIGSEAVFGR